MLGFIFNIPYTLLGLALGLISWPLKIEFRKDHYAFIVSVKKFWWAVGYLNKARAMTIGHVILLGYLLENKDLEHELVHVEQNKRMPLIQPFLYYYELIRKGYKNNKYEVEAYSKAGNVYKGK